MNMPNYLRPFDNFGSNPPSDKFLAWKMWVSRKLIDVMEENDCSIGMLSLLSSLPEEYIHKLRNAEISPSDIALVKISMALSIPRKTFSPPENLSLE